MSRRGAAVLLSLASVLSMLTFPASATPRDPRLDKVEAQVADLESRAESAAEDWNRARDQLAASQAKVAALQKKASAERASFAAVSKDLGLLVSSMYKSGMIDLDVQALFADNPTKFLSQMAAVQQISASQAVTLKRIRARRISLTQAEAAVKAEQAPRGYSQGAEGSRCPSRCKGSRSPRNFAQYRFQSCAKSGEVRAFQGRPSL